jgi:nitrous oxidase accessory protein NosD
MYSATAIAAAVAIAALAVNVIDTTPTQPSAGAVTTRVVAADGTGDFDTIAKAVAAAAAGDTVLVRPGSYVEAIVIDKDITLAGDGPREDIVISAPENGPTVDFGKGIQQFEWPYALLVDDTQAEVRGLTFAGAKTAVVVDGGAPMLRDLVFDGNEFGLLIQSGSTATVTENLMTGGHGIELADYSEPLIAGNILRGGPSIVGSMGDDGVVRDNTLTDPRNGIGLGGIGADQPTNALIERNTIAGASGYAISTSTSHGAGAPVIRDNTISGSRNGIQVGTLTGDGGSAAGGPDGATAQPLVSGNDISAQLIAISVSWTDAKVVDNTIHDSFNGIVLFGGGSAEIMDNEVEVDSIGIDIGANTSPNVVGNSACGGSASINVHDTATPTVGENTTCDPA